jgi:hypothetical protein
VIKQHDGSCILHDVAIEQQDGNCILHDENFGLHDRDSDFQNGKLELFTAYIKKYLLFLDFSYHDNFKMNMVAAQEGMPAGKKSPPCYISIDNYVPRIRVCTTSFKRKQFIHIAVTIR